MNATHQISAPRRLTPVIAPIITPAFAPLDHEAKPLLVDDVEKSEEVSVGPSGQKGVGSAVLEADENDNEDEDEDSDGVPAMVSSSKLKGVGVGRLSKEEESESR